MVAPLEAHEAVYSSLGLQLGQFAPKPPCLQRPLTLFYHPQRFFEIAAGVRVTTFRARQRRAR